MDQDSQNHIVIEITQEITLDDLNGSDEPAPAAHEPSSRLPGIVITTDRMARLFRPSGERSPSDVLLSGEDPSARIAPESRESGLCLAAWGGVSLPKLVRTSALLGWKGLEGLAGVPGNLGGGVAMNAGGRWGDMWDVVERVLVVDEESQLVELSKEQCHPVYRNGGLGKSIVASALLRFQLDSVRDVQERGKQCLLEKNRAQPVTEWSAGCVWKNPPKEKSDGLSAGQLVERCGGKGLQRGDAVVSERHGNFIVNRGKATATDVLTLMEDIEALVLERSAVTLQREVKVWRA